MEYKYEIIRGEKDLPIKAIIHSVDGLQMHWHNEMEILLVLEGSVNVRIGEEIHRLKQNDLVLINCNELHNTSKTEDANVLLALQINPEFYHNIYPQFNKMEFDCKSFIYEEDEQERFDIIKHYMAKIVWELNKKNQGYELIIGSYLHLLGAHLINNFDYTILEDETKELRDKDLYRLQSIIDYVNQNIDRKITLKEVAKREHISYYYLSHFIKDKMGMSFQEYINTIRLDKAVKMIVSTDMSIIDVSNSSGFPNINSFNNLFKENYKCTPTEFRKNNADNLEYNIENKNIRKKSKTYLNVDRDAALKKLFIYLKAETLELDKTMVKGDRESIYVDSKVEGKYFEHNWNQLITFGRAAEGLRANWQKQFNEIQKEIGFNYIRFHGIFMDEMMIYNISS